MLPGEASRRTRESFYRMGLLRLQPLERYPERPFWETAKCCDPRAHR